MDDGSKKIAKDSDVREFCQILSSFGDVYVNDAFGTMHRNHSSIGGIELGTKAGGLLVKKELQYFTPLLQHNAPKIDLAILGGSKVHDKIKIIENLIPRINGLFIGGGMAFTFLKKKGIEIGKSIFDSEGFENIDNLFKLADSQNVTIHLPCDYIIAQNISDQTGTKFCEGDIPPEFMGLDIGPKSIKQLDSLLEGAKNFVFWNGPVGLFEKDNFSKGTKSVMDFLGNCTQRGVQTIIAGGDSIAAATKFNAIDNFTHVSTGGGASMELLEGKILPGIAFLNDL
jgi:phosphoglycerate kinase